MNGAKADLLVTSPPYNQSIDKFRPSGMHREGNWVSKVEKLAYSDSMPEEDYQQQQIAALHVWATEMKEGASVFYNHKNRYRDKQVVSPLTWLQHGPFKIRQEIIWSRPGSVTQNARMFLPSDERIYWLYKGNDFYFDDATEIKSWSSVWDVKLETNRSHAVAFPVELPSRAIRACSKSGDVVLEPYCGSGTTVIAGETLTRSCYGSEILPVNCQVIIDRWEAFTGLKAEKVGELVAQ
jgi:DNA modification methylase